MKTGKHLIIILTIVLGITVLPVQAKTYYVATDGNDQTGDGATDNPFLTINKAFTVAWFNDPGTGDPTKDTIIVRRGTYNECVQASRPVATLMIGARGSISRTVFRSEGNTLSGSPAVRTKT